MQKVALNLELDSIKKGSRMSFLFNNHYFQLIKTELRLLRFGQNHHHS